MFGPPASRGAVTPFEQPGSCHSSCETEERCVMRKLVTVLVVGLRASVAATSATAATSQLPVVYNSLTGNAHSSPTASPPGANNWSCRPTAAPPRPVGLVHGTFENMADNGEPLSPLWR